MDSCEHEILNSDSKVKPFSVLSSSFNPQKIKQKSIKLKKLYYQDKTAFLLKNVFTKEECENLIEISEKNGYNPALLSIGGGYEILVTNVRKSYRTIIDDEEFVKILWSRISSYIPDPFDGYQAVGINERLRFLRYDPGDKFVKHQDSSYIRPNELEKSLITLQIYMNEGFKGGETTFFDKDGKRKIPIIPKQGMILVFQQNITHEGSELKTGRKYTIRTEVMYKK